MMVPTECNWSQCASARSWTQVDAAAINWTLRCHRLSESVFFKLRPSQRRARFPWRQSDVGSDLLWEREMRMRRDKTGDVVGRPSWRSSFLGDPGAKFLCGKLAIGTKRKEEQKERKAGGHCGRSKSSTGGTIGLEERMPEGSRVVAFTASVGSSTIANALLASPNAK